MTVTAFYPSRSQLGRVSVLLGCAALLSLYALHHGSYSLVDRQSIAVVVWLIVALAAGVGLLPAARPAKVLWIAAFSLVGLAVWVLVSLAWTESAERTVAEFMRICGYAGVLTLIWSGVGRKTWRLVAAGLLAAGVLVCSLVVLSRLWPGLFPVESAVIARTGRASYPFGYWNAIGCWAAMSIALCIAYAAHARSGVVRALALGAVPICSVALYAAVSRGGFAAAAIGAATVIALARNRWLTLLQALAAGAVSLAVVLIFRSHPQLADGTGSAGAGAALAAILVGAAVCAAIGYSADRLDLGPRRRMARSRARPLTAVAAVVLVVVLAGAAGAFGGDAWNQFTGKDIAATPTRDSRLVQLNGNRHNLWHSAWAAFESQPVHGIGPGVFEFWWNRNGVNGEFVRDAHNIYLEALAETGAIGLLLLLTFFAGLLLAALRARRQLRSSSDRGIHAGLVAVFIVFLVEAGVDWMWESTAVAVLALAAIATAGAADAVSVDRRQPGLGTIRAGLVLAAACAALVQLPGLASQHQIEQSQAAFRAHDFHRSAAAADRAVGAAPWSATALAQRALAAQAGGDLVAARTDIDHARRKEPTNWRWPLIAMRIEVRRGRPRAAVAAYEDAKRLRRYSAIFGDPGPAIR